MKVESIPIESIIIGDRRREDENPDLWLSLGFCGLPDRAYTARLDNFITAEIYPSLLTEHWHLAIYHNNHKYVSARPVWREQVAAWFRLRKINAEACRWTSKPCEPSERSPFDHAPRPRAPHPRPVKPPEIKPAPSVVYFVQAGPDGLIKIGHSNRPQQRVRDLSTASAAVLQPLGFIEGGQKQETALHRQFKHLRQHGEWFTPGPELLEYISTNSQAWAFLLFRAIDHFFSEVKRVGGILAFVEGWSEQERRELLSSFTDVRNILSGWADELSDSLNDARAETEALTA